MAAPTVRNRTAPVTGVNTTSPSDTEIDDLVIVFTHTGTTVNGIPTHTLQGGYTELFTQSLDDGVNDGRMSCAYIVATSAGAQSYNAYSNSTGTVMTGCVVITKATYMTDLAAGTGASSTGNTPPNPPNLTLGTSRDWMVIALGGWVNGSAVNNSAGAPTNYSNINQFSGSSIADLASAERALTAPASEDPGAFTDNSVPTGTIAGTVGIPSVTVSIAVPRNFLKANEIYIPFDRW